MSARIARWTAVSIASLLVVAGFAVAPAGAATSVSATGLCFGYPTTGGCRAGFGGTTTGTPGSTQSIGVILTATNGVAAGQQIVLDGSASGFTFSNSANVQNESTSTGCSNGGLSLTNSSQTLSVTMPAGCAASAGQKVIVFASNVVMPSTPGSYSLSLSTTNDTAPVGTNSLSLFTVPSAPKNLTAMAGNVSVDLSWDAPDSNGGTSLTGYDVYCTPAPSTPDTGGTPSATTDASTTSTTVTGLSARETFNCAVTAVNSVGQSDSSNVASARPYQIASSPTSFNAVRGNGSVTLSWAKPSDNGGSPVTEYRAYCSTPFPPTGDPSELCGTFASTKRTGVIQGLTNGVGYWIGLSAVNAAGDSPMAGPDTATPATVPSHPRRLRVIPESGALLLKWKAPTSDGGDPISQYTVTCQPSPPPFSGAHEYVTNETHRRVRGLVPGTEYWCEVWASNTVGQSKPSSVVTGTPT